MTTPGRYDTETSDMIAVHQALAGALDEAATLVGDAGDDAGRAEVIGSFCENVLEFLHVHHTGEDELIYPVLNERCAAQREMLRRIEAQHQLLDVPMDQARAAVSAWRSAPSAERGETLADCIGTVGRTLRPHLGEEEALVLPVASTYMSPEEWAQLPGHAIQSFAGDKPWLALGLVRERLTAEQRDHMLAGMPPDLRALWTDQWEPAFSSFIDDVRQ